MVTFTPTHLTPAIRLAPVRHTDIGLIFDIAEWLSTAASYLNPSIVTSSEHLTIDFPLLCVVVPTDKGIFGLFFGLSSFLTFAIVSSAVPATLVKGLYVLSFPLGRGGSLVVYSVWCSVVAAFAAF